MLQSASIGPRRWRSLRRFSLFVVLLLISWPVWVNAHGYKLSDITITHPWATPTHGSVDGKGYLALRNKGHKSDQLLSATTEVAARVELYSANQDHGVLKTHSVNALEIPAGKTVRLEPGKSHLMLIGLKKPLQDGQHFSLVLQFQHAGTITVDMFVQLNADESIY